MKKSNKYLIVSVFGLGLLWATFVFVVLKTSLGLFYYRMTHLSDEDLEWVRWAENHQMALFESNEGHLSELTVTEVGIANSRNPFYISSNARDNYQATASYDYTIRDSVRTLEGVVSVQREVDNDSLVGLFWLGALHQKGHDRWPIKIQDFDLQGTLMKNCVVMDSTIAYNIPNYHSKGDTLMLDKFVISKDYGPIYYKLLNGEEFFRKFQ